MLTENTQKLRHLLYQYSGNKIGNDASHQDLRKSAQLALQIFKANGAQAKLIEYEGFVAVEIISDARLTNGWNKMATALKQNYEMRLIYAPHSLVIHGTEAKFDRDSKTILISHESLRVGRGERRLLHEIGHMKSEATKLLFPNIFSGFVELAYVDESPLKTMSVAPGTTDYRDGQDLDEVVRFAQDLDRLGRELLTGSEVAVREELKFVASRGQDILANSEEAIRHAREVSKVIATENQGSGPLLQEDGNPAANRAFIAAGDNTQVSIERFETGTLRIRLEDNRLSSEIWVREDSNWGVLIQKLQRNEKAANREFSKRFTDLVQHWENELKPSLNALRVSSAAIISKGPSLSASELSIIAKAPRKIVAPHLRRESK